MATGISGRSFLTIVKRSGVVSEEELQRSLAALQQRDDISLDDPEALADALIAQGVLTRWQAEKMLQGKHKGFFLGPYRLLDMLGKGGMGAVYLAEHTLMRRRCAVKVLPSKNIGSRSYLERFYREAQAVAAMDHRNIVRAYDVNQAKVGDSDVHFLAMEFVEGRDLQRIVDEDGPLRYTEAAEYIRQAAEGLAHAHEAGMVHRDIKPANLLVNSRGVVKILDLGLAKFYEDQQEQASLTREHNETVLGTADYLAPEQAVDSHNINHQADIYSLGCTFYFLLTGHPPFCEGSVATRLLHHQIKPPPPIRNDRPDAPDSLVAIIERMMAKKRVERYLSAQDVADDLTVWLAENGSQEWREQNAELVRKVGESWRADTQVVAGASVDTGELDLRPDDDLDLAPDEDGADLHKSPSPAPTEKASEPTSAPESVLGLKSDEAAVESKVQPRNDKATGETPAAKRAGASQQAAPLAAVDLEPLEDPDLVSLDELQSLDTLSSDVLQADPLQTGSPGSGSDASALSSGLGLGQAAPPATSAGQPPPKQQDALPIPMPWIVAISCLALFVVLGVVVLMLLNSGDSEPTAYSPETSPLAPSTQPHDPPLAPEPDRANADGAGGDAAGERTGGADQPPKPPESMDVDRPTPLAKTDEAPSEETKVEPEEKAPPASVPAAESNAPTPPSPPAVASQEPKSVDPIPSPSASDQAPMPAYPPVETPGTKRQQPRDAPEVDSALPAPSEVQPISEERKKELLAHATDVSVKVESDVPNPIRDEIMFELNEKLKDAQLQETPDSSNTLHVTVKTVADQAKRGATDPQAMVHFSLSAELLIPDEEGRPIQVWSESLTNDSPVQAYVGRDRQARLPASLRKDVGVLFRKLSVAKRLASM